MKDRLLPGLPAPENRYRGYAAHACSCTTANSSPTSTHPECTWNTFFISATILHHLLLFLFWAFSPPPAQASTNWGPSTLSLPPDEPFRFLQASPDMESHVRQPLAITSPQHACPISPPCRRPKSTTEFPPKTIQFEANLILQAPQMAPLSYRVS